MTANEDYWDGQPQIDRLIFIKVEDPSTRAISAESGSVQAARAVPLTSVTALETAGIQLSFDYSDLVSYFLNHEVFNDSRIRQAMNYAINRTAIIEDLFDGYAKEALSPIPATCPYVENQTAYEYNTTKAIELLNDAGYPSGLNTTLWTLSGRYMYDKEVSEAVQGYLAAVGIDATIEVFDYGSYFGNVLAPLNETNQRISIIGWCASPGPSDPDYYMRSFYYGQQFVPYTFNLGYNNTLVSELIENASATEDTTLLESYYSQAQQIIWDDAVQIFMYTQPEITALSPDLQGVVFLPNHCADYRNAYLA
jgi:ABC-type transport system substrate-binding protein